MNKKHTMEELKDIAPLLNKLPKKDHFQAPDGYFDELPSMIQERVVVKPRFQWTHSLKYALPLVLVVASVIYFTQKNTTEQSVQISKQEAVDYLDNQLDTEFDETLLAEELSVQSVEKHTETSSMEEYILDEADEDLLIEEI